MLIIQSYEQLQKYSAKGKDYKTIKSQARLNYLLETNSEETLKSFSSSLGEKIVKKETVSKNDKSTSVSTSEQKELIMSISEIKYKDPDMTIISTGGSKPIALKLKPAYEYLNYEPYINSQPKMISNNDMVWDFGSMKLKKFNLFTTTKVSDNDGESDLTKKEVEGDFELVTPNNDELLKQALKDIKKTKSLCIDLKSD
ncbi:TraM recognition domain-containing protein [Mycoplasma mycoides]|uniref:TraM recognition domain-containing protein n=1 Tax=Mycoplasma mycoides TaxID=2102 RepID=UPI00223F026E|nr:TraM recognition domain-containing protein [Mycoplasma mycoides]